MAYGTKEGVLALLHDKWELDGTSTPTDAEVTALIDQVSEGMDGILSAAGYVTPVEATVPYNKHLVHIAEAAVAARVYTIKRDEKGAIVWQAIYNAWKKATEQSKGLPASLAADSDAPVAASYLDDYPEDPPDLGRNQTPWFQRDQAGTGGKSF